MSEKQTITLPFPFGTWLCYRFGNCIDVFRLNDVIVHLDDVGCSFYTYNNDVYVPLCQAFDITTVTVGNLNLPSDGIVTDLFGDIIHIKGAEHATSTYINKEQANVFLRELLGRLKDIKERR